MFYIKPSEKKKDLVIVLSLPYSIHKSKMSLLENTFLHIPLQHALQVYSQQVAPKLTKDNKCIAIGTAIALSLIYLIQDRILKPCRNLRHIPYLSYLGTLRSMLRDESIWDRSHRLHLPLIEAENSKGLFLVCILARVSKKKKKICMT